MPLDYMDKKRRHCRVKVPTSVITPNPDAKTYRSIVTIAVAISSGGRDRTYDNLINSQGLLPLSYTGKFLVLEPMRGLEPPTSCLQGRYSSIELHRQILSFLTLLFPFCS